MIGMTLEEKQAAWKPYIERSAALRAQKEQRDAQLVTLRLESDTALQAYGQTSKKETSAWTDEALISQHPQRSLAQHPPFPKQYDEMPQFFQQLYTEISAQPQQQYGQISAQPHQQYGQILAQPHQQYGQMQHHPSMIEKVVQLLREQQITSTAYTLLTSHKVQITQDLLTFLLQKEDLSFRAFQELLQELPQRQPQELTLRNASSSQAMVQQDYSPSSQAMVQQGYSPWNETALVLTHAMASIAAQQAKIEETCNQLKEEHQTFKETQQGLDQKVQKLDLSLQDSIKAWHEGNQLLHEENKALLQKSDADRDMMQQMLKAIQANQQAVQQAVKSKTVENSQNKGYGQSLPSVQDQLQSSSSIDWNQLTHAQSLPQKVFLKPNPSQQWIASHLNQVEQQWQADQWEQAKQWEQTEQWEQADQCQLQQWQANQQKKRQADLQGQKQKQKQEQADQSDLQSRQLSRQSLKTQAAEVRMRVSQAIKENDSASEPET